LPAGIAGGGWMYEWDEATTSWVEIEVPE